MRPEPRTCSCWRRSRALNSSGRPTAKPSHPATCGTNSATAPSCSPRGTARLLGTKRPLDTRQVWRRYSRRMQIREHCGSETKPAKPAIILHPSGTVVTFDELEARANRLAHHFRRAGLREGDAVAILMENNEHIHAVMWAA